MANAQVAVTDLHEQLDIESARVAKEHVLRLDVAGHGLLSRFHDGCRCAWCTARARERGCLCPECLTVRTAGIYVGPVRTRP